MCMMVNGQAILIDGGSKYIFAFIYWITLDEKKKGKKNRVIFNKRVALINKVDKVVILD